MIKWLKNLFKKKEQEFKYKDQPTKEEQHSIRRKLFALKLAMMEGDEPTIERLQNFLNANKIKPPEKLSEVQSLLDQL